MAGRSVGGAEGIVNGMDTTDWSPAVDKFLDVKYDEETVEEGKAIAKETLQAELGLEVCRCPFLTPWFDATNIMSCCGRRYPVLRGAGLASGKLGQCLVDLPE
jgi:hypothetical protein